MFIYVNLFLLYHMICDFVMIIKIKLIDVIFCFILLLIIIYYLMIYKLPIYFSLGYFVSDDLGMSGFIHMFGLCCGADPSQSLRSVDFWFIV